MPHPEIEPLLAEARRENCMFPYAYAAGGLAANLATHRTRLRGAECLLVEAGNALRELGETDECRCDQMEDPEPDETCSACHCASIARRAKLYLEMNAIIVKPLSNPALPPE